jgi:hypothetical protein
VSVAFWLRLVERKASVRGFLLMEVTTVVVAGEERPVMIWGKSRDVFRA